MTPLEELREWPKETVLKLFEYVKPYPILYDQNHKDWMNKTQKGKIWLNIAQLMDPTCNLTSKRCRDKFVTLRKRYSNDIRKQIANGNLDIDQDLLWLLIQVNEEKENFSKIENIIGKFSEQQINGDGHSPTNDHENGKESGFNSHESEEDAALLNPDDIPTSFSSTLMDFINKMPPVETDSSDGERPEKRRKRKNSIPRKLEQIAHPVKQEELNTDKPLPVNFFADYLASLQASNDQQKQKEVEEECNLFGRQVELDLRRLTQKNRALARIKIASILAEFCQKEI
jgi:hypothetical protein